MQQKDDGPVKKRLNPFIEFCPREKDAKELAQQADGPASPSLAADTLRPNSRPADRAPFKKKSLKEADANFEFDMDEAIRRYLHKRRMNWVYRIDESTNLGSFMTMLEDFASYAATYLDLKTMPPINLVPPQSATTFATWSPLGIDISVSNRHPMDVFRSVAHELVHHKQHEDDELHTESGVTGSDHENEANALAGIMMRNYAKDHPDLFELEAVSEGFLHSLLFGSGKKKPQPTSASQAGRVLATHRASKPQSSPESSVSSAVNKMEIKRKAKDEFAKRHLNDNKKGDLETRIQAAAARLSKHPDPDYDAKIKAATEKRTSDALQAHKDWLENNKKFPLPKSASGTKPFSDLIRGLKESMALLSKANKSGIPYGVLNEVYNRGISVWTKDETLTPAQFAFNRVNSFIAGGKARELDIDLIEKKIVKVSVKKPVKYKIADIGAGGKEHNIKRGTSKLEGITKG